LWQINLVISKQKEARAKVPLLDLLKSFLKQPIDSN
jgi:hypothetical protein